MSRSTQIPIFTAQSTIFVSDFFEKYGLYFVGILAILSITLSFATKGRFFAYAQTSAQKPRESNSTKIMALTKPLLSSSQNPQKHIPSAQIRNLLSAHESYLEARFQRRPGAILSAKRSLDSQFLTLTGEPYGNE